MYEFAYADSGLTLTTSPVCGACTNEPLPT